MYCKKCGKEVLDDAVICTGCGSWVKEEPKKQTDMAATEKSAKLSKLFGVIAFSLIMTTLFFVFAGIAGWEVSTRYGYTDIVWDSASIGGAIVFGSIALGFGITSFVFGIKAKENIAIRYIATLIFIMSIVVYLIPFLFV